jgi:beta-glucosidase
MPSVARLIKHLIKSKTKMNQVKEMINESTNKIEQEQEKIKRLIEYNNRQRKNIQRLKGNITKTVQNQETKPFLWGAASSAFQIEGSPTGESIWDKYVDNFNNDPINIENDVKLEPDVACNSYKEYEKDIQALEDLGLNAYRVSISWCRLFPKGKSKDDNGKWLDYEPDGFKYYTDLFAALKNAYDGKGITPIVTLWHWDLPSAFQDDPEYNGWISGKYDDTGNYIPLYSQMVNDEGKLVNNENVPMIAKDFADYAEFCFTNFKDIRYWGSINEAQTYAVGTIQYNWQAPATGNSEGISSNGAEYRVGHNMLIAHGEANKRLRNLTKTSNETYYFGMMNNGDFGSPYSTNADSYTSDQATIEAAERRNQFWLGWFNGPIFHGDYPQIMRDMLKDTNRLPAFTEDQIATIQGSSNIMYINTYTCKYVCDALGASHYPGWSFDSETWDQDYTMYNGEQKYIGKKTDSGWNRIVDNTLLNLLAWYQYHYSGNSPEVTNPGVGIRCYTNDEEFISIPVMITENGLSPLIDNNPGLTDPDRETYYNYSFSALGEVIPLTGINLIGFLAWSLCDNFEWTNGYTQRFGFFSIETDSSKNEETGITTYTTTRVAKDSTEWYKKYVKDYPNGPNIKSTFYGITYGPGPDPTLGFAYYDPMPPIGEIKPESSSPSPRGR